MSWVGIPYVARELGVTESSVRKWILEGRISAIRAGGKLLRVEKKELDRFLRDARIRASNVGGNEKDKDHAASPRPGRAAGSGG
jgi:excisionase family DNA binding protein